MSEPQKDVAMSEYKKENVFKSAMKRYQTKMGYQLFFFLFLSVVMVVVPYYLPDLGQIIYNAVVFSGLTTVFMRLVVITDSVNGIEPTISNNNAQLSDNIKNSLLSIDKATVEKHIQDYSKLVDSQKETQKKFDRSMSNTNNTISASVAQISTELESQITRLSTYLDSRLEALLKLNEVSDSILRLDHPFFRDCLGNVLTSLRSGTYITNYDEPGAYLQGLIKHSNKTIIATCIAKKTSGFDDFDFTPEYLAEHVKRLACGVKITRIFILPSENEDFDETSIYNKMKSQYDMRKHGEIDVRFVRESSKSKSNGALCKDFLIMDDEILMMRGEKPKQKVTKIPGEVKAYRQEFYTILGDSYGDCKEFDSSYICNSSTDHKIKMKSR
ncbi:MAG: hypothetical protein LBS19_08480 [Clostridiales bacterium]|jgi:hypothetical protein|nr:hypothetical protein [Clostridiales bacterium]